jgi:hypothetical protein
MPNAPGGLFYPILNSTPSPPPATKIVTVIISGVDPSSLTLDEQARYAFRSVQNILIDYGINAFAYKDDLAAYCASPIAGVPVLYLWMNLTSTSNKYTSGYRTIVDIRGTQMRCQSSNNVFADHVTFRGHEDHTYLSNPFQAALAVFALSTSPWITKNKIYINAPSTILDSFMHVQDAADGAVYCAVAGAMAQFLQQPNPVVDTSSPNVTPTPKPPDLLPCGAEAAQRRARRQALF